MNYMSRIDEFHACHSKHQSWQATADDMNLSVEQVRRLARKVGATNADFGKELLATRNAGWRAHGKPPTRPALQHGGRTKQYDTVNRYCGNHLVPRHTLDPLPSLQLPLPNIGDD